MRIGEVAREAGLRVSAIRYYEEIGLLPEAARESGQRVFDRSVLRRLSLIDVSQRAGLTLDEIKDLMDAGTDPVSERIQKIAQRKLPEVEALIHRAEAMRDWLEAARECRCASIDECGLFDAAHVRGRPTRRGPSALSAGGPCRE